MKSGIFLVFVAIFQCFEPLWGQNTIEQAHRDLFDLIGNPEKYDHRIRPYGTNDTAPVVVTTDILVRRIYDIKESEKEFSVQLTFRNNWVDKRLAYKSDVKYLTLPPGAENIWVPDVFFSNEFDSHLHYLIRPNVLLRVYPDGKVFQSMRISIRLSCPMNLRRYPHDTQNCRIVMPSYGYTTEDLALVWKSDDPIQIGKNLNIDRYSLTAFYSGNCNSKTTTGEYSCLVVDFVFERSFSSFLLRVYIPSFMIILMSYLHFWMSITAITGRMILALGTLVTMTAGCVDLSHTVPQSGYTKAIDVWTGVCLTFLFSSLVELVVVHYLARRNSADALPSGDGATPEKNIQLKRLLNVFSNHPLPERIDVITRVAYPSLFLLFNMIYWSIYLPSEVIEAGTA